MELIINEAIKVPKTINTYELILKFMEGDADGYENVIIRFTEDIVERPEFRKELETFIKSILQCIVKDSRGRGGFTDDDDLIREYKDIQDWARYCWNALDYIIEEVEDDLLDYTDIDLMDDFGINKKDIEEVINQDIKGYRELFMYHLPTHSEGWYDSYKDLDLFYYDEHGDKHTVTIQI